MAQTNSRGTLASKITGVDASAAAGLDGSSVIAAGAIKALKDTGPEFLFKKAVVVEVINDVYEFSLLMEDGGKYYNKVANEEVAQQAPRNSLLVAPHGDGTKEELLLCIPFFPSHLSFPAKVGETVWWIPGPSYPYWFCRISSTDQIEDVNYTHLDQEYITPVPLEENAKEKSDSQQGNKKRFVPQRNDGIGGEGDAGLRNVHPNYSPSNLASLGLYNNTPEAIPRWTPRVGDLVLQGSNNTLISLGTDRGWSKNDEEDTFEFSNATDDIVAGTGTIDIVVGRGMLEDDPTPGNESAAGANPTRTKPRTVTSKEGNVETDKTFGHNDDDPNRAEGDPDFHTDLSRVYVTMKSQIDQKLAITEEYNDPIAGEFTDSDNAAIALKSNEIRIVSREDGSIRILKEKGEGQGSSIVMMPDGSIHISGDKIYIGQPGGSGEGENGSEAYVLHSYLKDWCTQLHTELDVFCQTLMTHVTPGYGAPSPQITSAATTLKANLVKVKQVISNFPSKRIYGE